MSALTARQLGRDDHATVSLAAWLCPTRRWMAGCTSLRAFGRRGWRSPRTASTRRGATCWRCSRWSSAARPTSWSGVMGALTEVAARAGQCRKALDYAQRSIRVAADAGLSPGPSWYFGAVAELAGGTLERGIAYAQRGVVASEQEGDQIYLRHNLHALGHAQRRSGLAREAAETLRRVQAIESDCGICDPANLSWHSDLVAPWSPRARRQKPSACWTRRARPCGSGERASPSARSSTVPARCCWPAVGTRRGARGTDGGGADLRGTGGADRARPLSARPGPGRAPAAAELRGPLEPRRGA